MNLRVIFSTLIFLCTLQFAQAQGGIFGEFEKAFNQVDELFTGDRAEAAEAKRRADAEKARVEYQKKQDELVKIADAKEKERIEVYALDANGENQLMRAVRANDPNVSKDLIKRGANASVVNKRGVTPLHEAVKVGNPELIDLMIVNGANINARDQSGKTPLDYAMLIPNQSVVNSLVLNNAPIEIQHIDRAIQLEQSDVLEVLLVNSDKAPAALYSALTRGKTDMFVEILETYNVEIDNSVFNYAVDKRNNEIAEVVMNKGINLSLATDYAISKNANQIIESLLIAGGDANKVLGYAVNKRNHSLAESTITVYNADPNPFVATAIDKNDMKLLDMLLNNGADANKGMAHAVTKKNVVIVKKLLDNSADPNSQIKQATKAKSFGMVEAMIDAGADANLGIKEAIDLNETRIAILLLDSGADGSAKEYIIKACENSNEKLVEKLIEKGADANNGMKIAINKNSTGIVNKLIDAGADASDPAFIKQSVTVENEVITKKLLEAGADPNNGIKISVEKNNLAITKLLIANGADASSRELLMSAVRHNSEMLTEVLFEAGANPEEAVKPAIEAGAHIVVEQLVSMGQDVATADYLNTAVSRKHSATAGIILKNGVDANSPVVTGSGYKMLHVACKNNDLNTVQVLLQFDADPTAVASSTGDTPLHVAVSNKGKTSASIVEALIAAGADVNAKNNSGDIVFQMAKGTKVKKVLKKNGASKGK